MFLVDRDANEIRPLSKPLFSELKIREREHLQEWIAKQPKCLGEELLIIQKEFDGWADTNERLDLLALDKKGGIVVIENKLDDSGRDVVWQALKYAAYCSTLSKDEVIDVFRKYLRGDAERADDILMDFFDVGDLDEIAINEGANQRIILVAAKFRKEVTATCLWLLDRKIDMRCIRATPYDHDGELFLGLDQIIPPPETEDYMIKVGSKKVDENIARTGEIERHRRRREFWTQFLDAATDTTKELFSTKGPTIDSWLSGRQIYKGMTHWVVFTRKNIRYEFHFDSSDKDLNTRRYKKLLGKRDQVKQAFGDEILDWDIKEAAIRSAVSVSLDVDGSDASNWPVMIQWAHSQVATGMETFDPMMTELSAIN